VTHTTDWQTNDHNSLDSATTQQQRCTVVQLINPHTNYQIMISFIRDLNHIDDSIQTLYVRLSR